jgi:Coatomer WD associated region.
VRDLTAKFDEDVQPIDWDRTESICSGAETNAHIYRVTGVRGKGGSQDVGSLLLLHTASGNQAGLKALATQASESGLHNVAFSTLWSLGDVDGCIDLLIATNRIGEAVLFAQTYKPSRAPELVVQWKSSLEGTGKTKVSRLIGVPPGAPDIVSTDDDLFPEWDEYLRMEKEGVVPEPPSSESLIDIDGDKEPASATNGGPEVEAEAKAEAEDEEEEEIESEIEEAAAAEAE